MPKALTEMEQRVLDYLFEYLRRNTYQPSVREIGSEFSIRSTKTVSEILQSLADKGWVQRDPSRSRGVRLLGMDTAARAVAVPFADSEEMLQLDRRLAGGAGVFVIPMQGDHLRGEGVNSGDLLVIEPVAPASVESGDLVLVQIAGAASVRRCMREAGNIILEPVRDEKVSITLSPQQSASALLGRIATIIRRTRARAEPTASPQLPAT